MDIAAYLSRIDLPAAVRPDRETLFALHRAHLLAVPFENLDIHLGRRIRLDETALYDKIVRRRRGGFCYELNGLFHELLRRLGYQATLLNSIIPPTLNGCGLPFDHPVLLVEMERRWLVDVGFGDAFRPPLDLDQTADQAGLGDTGYRIARSGDRFSLWQRSEAGDWEHQYSLSLQPCSLSDFQEACEHYETSPRSSFTRKRICSRATPDGSISLSELQLIVTEDGRRRELTLPDEGAFRQALHEQFGVNLTVAGKSPRPTSGTT